MATESLKNYLYKFMGLHYLVCLISAYYRQTIAIKAKMAKKTSVRVKKKAEVLAQ